MIIMGPEILSAIISQSKSIQWNLKTVLTLLFFPVTLPVLTYTFIQAFRKKFGYKKRKLEGKVILITGASSGIGEALARILYTSGCRLILASRRHKELERVKAELVRIKTFGPVYVPAVLELDLADLHSLPAKANNALQVYGHIDCLINNAGVSFRGSVVDTTIEVDQEIMAINYFGPLCLTKNIVHSMIERQSGHIIFVSSVQGKIAIPYRSAYTASKHALQAAADSLRAEINEYNINVTVVSPGYVRTNLSVSALTSSGNKYGQVDETTKNGDSPDYIAQQIIKAYFNGDKEVVICSLFPKFAIFLRYVYPALFFRLMASRAKNTAPAVHED